MTEQTRHAYDTVAADYADLLEDSLARMPLDRALLAAFVESCPPGRLLDAGCGPGRITAHLHDSGADVEGVDLSPGMIEQAVRRHPGLPFRVGTFGSLGLADASYGGILAWYSLIHTVAADLPAILTELGRALVPGGQLLVAFPSGVGEELHRTQAYGHDVELISQRHDPEAVMSAIEGAGLQLTTRVVREPSEAYETSQQVYLLAIKPT